MFYLQNSISLVCYLLTVADFKEGVHKEFANKNRKVEVEDIYVLPNYCGYLNPSIDKKLSGYTKQEKTLSIVGVEQSSRFNITW